MLGKELRAMNKDKRNVARERGTVVLVPGVADRAGRRLRQSWGPLAAF